MSAIALSSCIETIDMLDQRQFQGKKRGERTPNRVARRLSAP
jgi:hypothetical protein